MNVAVWQLKSISIEPTEASFGDWAELPIFTGIPLVCEAALNLVPLFCEACCEAESPKRIRTLVWIDKFPKQVRLLCETKSPKCWKFAREFKFPSWVTFACVAIWTWSKRTKRLRSSKPSRENYICLKTLTWISRRRLPDYVKTLHPKACRTCCTNIFLHSTNQIIDCGCWKMYKNEKRTCKACKLNLCARVSFVFKYANFWRCCRLRCQGRTDKLPISVGLI